MFWKDLKFYNRLLSGIGGLFLLFSVLYTASGYGDVNLTNHRAGVVKKLISILVERASPITGKPSYVFWVTKDIIVLQACHPDKKKPAYKRVVIYTDVTDNYYRYYFILTNQCPSEAL